MSHHVYQTEAFILETQNRKERDKSIVVLTRELGVVRAVASGVRDVKSKLRSGLVELSLCSMSFVRGKEVWRIINCSPIDNVYYTLRDKPSHLQMLMRIVSILKRLLRGEEKNTELFEIFTTMMLSLAVFEEERLPAIEALTMLRIMHNLGYIGQTDVFERFLTAYTIDNDMCVDIMDVHGPVIQEINRALRESNL